MVKKRQKQLLCLFFLNCEFGDGSITCCHSDDSYNRFPVVDRLCITGFCGRLKTGLRCSKVVC